MALWIFNHGYEPEAVYHRVTEPQGESILAKKNLGDSCPVLEAYSQTVNGSNEIDLFVDDLLGKQTAPPEELLVITALRKTISGAEEVNQFISAVNELVAEARKNQK